MRLTLMAAVCAGALLSTSAFADPLPAGSAVVYTVPGTSSIYQVNGRPGNTGGDYGPSTNAIQSTFAAGAGNVFTFSATGLVSCCSNSPDIPPDGAIGNNMNVTGANGLSSLIGNAAIPLVGVFMNETDPFGSAAPATLTFDANNPAGLSPLLNQVFYIGDGRAGYNNSLGALLTYTAPTSATRLYVGAIDAYGFNGVTGYYADNQGSWSVRITHLVSGVPEPSTWLTMLIGFGALGWQVRRRRSDGERVATF